MTALVLALLGSAAMTTSSPARVAISKHRVPRVLHRASQNVKSHKRKAGMERITFETSDGVTIVGDWTAGDAKKSAVLMLHMMPADRGSWRPLSQKLAAQGIAVLAIDLRGHGESVRTKAGKTVNYKIFSDVEHQASRLDVDAALLWLKQKGYDASRVAIVGASIGANLAIDAAVRYPQIANIVMLSGGLDFRGVQTEPAAKKLTPSQHVLLVASADDDYSFQSHRTLANILGARAIVQEFKTAGHGTTMFAHESKLIDEIVAWLNR